MRDNILFGRPEVTVILEWVLAASALAEFVSGGGALPNGLETLIGERGQTLSVKIAHWRASSSWSYSTAYRGGAGGTVNFRAGSSSGSQ